MHKEIQILKVVLKVYIVCEIIEYHSRGTMTRETINISN